MAKKIVPTWVYFALVLFATGTVWLRLNIIRTTYVINETNQAIEKSHQENELLTLKLADLKSPRKLEILARKKFKLSQPKIDQVIHFTRTLRGEIVGSRK